MHPTLFKIGIFEIRIYSLMYILAFISGIFIASRDEVARKRGIKDKKMIEDFAFVAMLSGLIGARLYYVALKFPDYMHDPMAILRVWEGGLAIHGGILGGLVGSYIFAKRNGISLWVLTDMGVGPLLFGQFLGRFGNLANGEIHGVPTFTPLSVIFSGKFESWWASYQNMGILEQMKFKELVPWGVVFPPDSPAGMEFPGVPLHPAMIYEGFLNLIGFILIWFVFRKKEYREGVLSMIYLIMYAVIRVFVSTFRVEDLRIAGIRAPYLISIVMVIAAAAGIRYFKSRPEKVTAENPGEAAAGKTGNVKNKKVKKNEKK